MIEMIRAELVAMIAIRARALTGRGVQVETDSTAAAKLIEMIRAELVAMIVHNKS